MIERLINYTPHGDNDWSFRDTYTFIATDTLVYHLGVVNSGDTPVKAESFRVDNSQNGNQIIVELGARRLQVPPFGDLFNECERAGWLKITGSAGDVLNIEIYGESFRASPTVDGRKSV